MMEHADGSKMRVSVVSLFLKSLDVVSASGRVAELSCTNLFRGTAVGMGFECRTRCEPGDKLDGSTRWGSRGCVQRSSESRAREQQSVATRVDAAQEGLGEAMRQVLAASSTRETSVANQMGGQCVRHFAV